MGGKYQCLTTTMGGKYHQMVVHFPPMVVVFSPHGGGFFRELSDFPPMGATHGCKISQYTPWRQIVGAKPLVVFPPTMGGGENQLCR